MVWEDGEECRLVKQEVVTGTAHKYGKVPHCAETPSQWQHLRFETTNKRKDAGWGPCDFLGDFFFLPTPPHVLRHESRVLAFARVASALFCKEHRHRIPTILCSSQSWM
eukprot:g28196.t1